MIPRCIMYQDDKKKLLLFCFHGSLYYVLLFSPLTSPHFVNCVHLFLACFSPYLLYFLCSCVCWTVLWHMHVLHVFVQCSLCCTSVLCSLPATVAPIYWSYPSLTLSSQVLSILALPCLLSFSCLPVNWPSWCLPSLQVLHIVCHIVRQTGSIPGLWPSTWLWLCHCVWLCPASARVEVRSFAPNFFLSQLRGSHWTNPCGQVC